MNAAMFVIPLMLASPPPEKVATSAETVIVSVQDLAKYGIIIPLPERQLAVLTEYNTSGHDFAVAYDEVELRKSTLGALIHLASLLGKSRTPLYLSLDEINDEEIVRIPYQVPVRLLGQFSPEYPRILAQVLHAHNDHWAVREDDDDSIYKFWPHNVSKSFFLRLADQALSNMQYRVPVTS